MGKLHIEIVKIKKSADETRRFIKRNPKGLNTFDIYQSTGGSKELVLHISDEIGVKVNFSDFDKRFEKHRKLSQKGAGKKFKGGLGDHSEEVTKLHTTTHLLHAALRKVLGESVQQKGSNITSERLRFDFSHPQKLTEEEMEKVEDLINEQIGKDLLITVETKTFEEAKKEGALAFFEAKYGEKVKVYSIGGSTDPSTSSGLPPFSREVCGGPHVARTGKIGRVKIKKQEKIGAGLMRIYAVIA